MDSPASPCHARGVARQAQRHLKWLFVGGTLGLIVTAATNLMVNPWRVLPRATEIKALDRYRDIDAEKRTCKGGLAMRGPWDVLVIGSSRPDSGIDPELPVFEGKPTVNLGMPGGDLYETRAMLDLALKYQHPKRALLFLDAGDLTRPGKIRIDSDFEISPMATGDPVERNLRYIFSQNAISCSIEAVRYPIDEQLSTRLSPKWLVHHYQKHPYKGPAYTPFGRHRKQTDLEDFKNYFTILKRYLPWAGELSDDQRRGLGVQADKLKVVRAMLDACADHGVEAILAIPPNHLTLTQAMEEQGAPDPFFLKERRALADLVTDSNKAHATLPCQLWDLNLPSPTTREPFPLEDGVRMTSWLDPVHFTPAAGARYVGLMWGTHPEEAELGIHVNATDTEAYLATVEARFKAAEQDLPTERGRIHRAIVDKEPTPEGKK